VPRRDDPALLAAERARDRDFPAVDESEDLIPDFAIAIRSADERVAVEDSFHIREVDLVNAQIAFAFPQVPCANRRRKSSAIATHAKIGFG
jgi:hypothetical protein